MSDCGQGGSYFFKHGDHDYIMSDRGSQNAKVIVSDRGSQKM